jgi:hypothetical protein
MHPEKYNPVKESLWFFPYKARHYHLWKAGNPNSVCGLYWENAAYSFECHPEHTSLPLDQLCPICAKEAKAPLPLAPKPERPFAGFLQEKKL